MKKYQYSGYRMLLAVTVVAAIIFTMCLTSCSTPQSKPFDISSITSYRDIPGVTAEEIAAVEAVVASHGSFSYGAMLETEAFILHDGTYAGFAVHMCKLLSGMFGMPFNLEIRDSWESFKSDIDSYALDFTNVLTPTEERMRTYFMTSPIGERRQSLYMRAENYDDIRSENDLIGRNIGCLGDSVDAELINRYYPELSISFIKVGGFDEAAQKLLAGEIDGFAGQHVSDPEFEKYEHIRSRDLFPLAYSPIAFSTANPALKPLIDVFNKYISAGGIDTLYELYRLGDMEYARYKLRISYTDEERKYLDALISSGGTVKAALEVSNYPISFYNKNTEQFEGIVPDILEEISDMTGITFEIANDENASWTEILDMLRSGEASVISELLYTQERDGHFLWADKPNATTHYALISKNDYPSLTPLQVIRARVGLVKDTAQEYYYHEWFPYYDNITYYGTEDDMLKALEADEIDMLMSAEYLLLMQHNYYERPYYKVNIRFGTQLDSHFGFHINETVLCSIINKTQEYIDSYTIASDWLNRGYDYTKQITRAQMNTLYIALGFLLVLSTAATVFFVINRKKSKVISNLLENEKKLAQSELTQRVLASKAMGVGLWSRNLDDIINMSRETLLTSGHPMKYTQEFRQLLGFTDENDFPDLLTSWFSRIHPDDKSIAFDNLKKHLDDPSGKTPYESEYRMKTKSGEYRYYRVSGETLRDDKGRPVQIGGAIKDITEIARIEEYARLMLDSGPLCTQIWNRDCRVIDCNKAAIELYGFDSKEEYIEKWVEECSPEFQPDDLRSDEKALSLVKRAFDGEKLTFEWMQKLRDGTPLPAEVTLVRVKYKDDYIVVGYTRDLREEKLAQQKLRESSERARNLEIQRKAAEAANDAKTRFLASMSHEIRTPMNVIVGMADLLLSENLEYRQYQYAHDIKTSSASLLNIINDILDISQIQSAKLTLLPVHYNFRDFIENIISVGKYLIKDKAISSKSGELHCNYSVDSSIPEYLYGDDVRLRQVFINLVSNAVKYTDEGTINVSVISEGTHMRVTVSDTGMGIKEKDLPHIFVAFERANSMRTRKQQGTGLGLAITKSLVELMGGEICCESEYGKGTSFSFTIPIVKGDASKAAVAQTPEPVHAPNADVLIVDDRELNLSVIHGLLMQCDIDADTALSGSKAVEMVQNKKYDLIFMDHMMPEMDGTEATEILRGQGFDVPIIALTANAVSGAKESMLASGMNDFLSKPIDKPELYRILGQWLPAEKIIIKENTEFPAADKNVNKPDGDADYSFWEKAGEIEGLSIHAGLATASNSRDDYKNTLRLLMRETAQSTKALPSFLEKEDMKGFCTEAHGIKGSLTLAGALELSVSARDLENASRDGDIEFCRDNLPAFTARLDKLGGDIKKVFEQTENKSKSPAAVISPELRDTLAGLSDAVDNKDLDKIFSSLETLEKSHLDGEQGAEISSLIEALQIMDYGRAKEIMSSFLHS